MKRVWASHPENSKFNFNDECIIKLLELYVKGKDENKKSYRVTIERAYDILMNEIISNNWIQKMTLNVPKNKSFFLKKLDTMQRLLNKISTEKDDKALEEEEIEEIRILNSMRNGDIL